MIGSVGAKVGGEFKPNVKLFKKIATEFKIGQEVDGVVRDNKTFHYFDTAIQPMSPSRVISIHKDKTSKNKFTLRSDVFEHTGSKSTFHFDFKVKPEVKIGRLKLLPERIKFRNKYQKISSRKIGESFLENLTRKTKNTMGLIDKSSEGYIKTEGTDERVAIEKLKKTRAAFRFNEALRQILDREFEIFTLVK